jgi:hypothetical protein
MATPHRLSGRLERLEASAAQLAAEHGGSREWLLVWLAHLAERIHDPPEPPLALQSPAERTVRAGLAAAEGAEGQAYARRCWQAVAAQLREYVRRGEP